MAKSKIIDIDRATYLYDKYKSINRAALSLGCSPTTLKKVFVNNGIELKKSKPTAWSINYSRKCIN
mgnify:CR=1 FL=1